MPATFLRIIVLCVLIFLASQKVPQFVQWQDGVTDQFDKRPAVTVLFIGNSRSAVADWPFMVRKIADSANSKTKYQITMDTPSGTSLKNHWESAQTQKLLQQKWDYISLQGQSNEQLFPQLESSFQYYGKRIADLGRSKGAKILLFVSWRYADNSPAYVDYPQFRSTMHGLIQQSYYTLALNSGARMVNVGQAWEKILATYPRIPLYEGQDFNHESIQGAYLCALMFYRTLSGDDLGHVTYAPPGISPEEALILKQAAQFW